MYHHPREINHLHDPVVCCGKCKAPVFEVPTPVNVMERIFDTLFRVGAPIPPQPQPRRHDVQKCAGCGAVWRDVAKELPFLVAERCDVMGARPIG